MDQAIKEQWVKALRSGEYRQTTSYLRTRKGFCCLGVLCDLAVKDQVIPGPVPDLNGSVMAYDGSKGSLPRSVSEWAGLDYDGSHWDNPEVEFGGSYRTTLAEINDDGMSFREIADIIEENL